MPLHVPASDVPEDTAQVGDSSFTTRAAYGNEASLMLATRPAGYHSRPHYHECEQLNHVTDGEIWVFVDDRAHLLRSGDFLRIPARAVHWAWNRSAGPCSMVEVHAPGMQDDPTVSGFAVALFDDDEQPRLAGAPVNVFLGEDSGFDPGVAEKQALEESR